MSVEEVDSWTWRQKADFLSGHPLIGEFKGAETASDKEQGDAETTPAVVYKRLAHLNALYSKVFPHLVYVTYVAGRSRSDIVPDMECLIGIQQSPSPLPSDYQIQEPGLDSVEVNSKIRIFEGEVWKQECQRGLDDVWAIARARLMKYNLI